MGYLQECWRVLPVARAAAAWTLAIAAGVLVAGRADAGPRDPHTEIFAGIGAESNSVSGYLGVGYAFGKGLYESGWRVRAVGSLGAYDYRGTLFGAGSELATTFDGEARYGAALVGYQFRREALFLKLFAGFEAEDQAITPHDPENSVQGSAVGAKLVAETWWDATERLYASLDASYGTAFQEYWSLARLGYRVGPILSLGVEGGALGNEEYDAGKAGGFARFALPIGEATLSGGFTGNYLEDEPSGYVALGLYRAF